MPISDDYLGSHRFFVSLGGAAPADGFTSVGALVQNNETISWKHGMDPHVRKAPGRLSWEDITLERVYNDNDAFALWRQSIIDGKSDRRDIVIEFKDLAGTTRRGYTLSQCFPTRWELPALDANGSNSAMEKITVAFESVIAN